MQEDIATKVSRIPRSYSNSIIGLIFKMLFIESIQKYVPQKICKGQRNLTTMAELKIYAYNYIK